MTGTIRPSKVAVNLSHMSLRAGRRSAPDYLLTSDWSGLTLCPIEKRVEKEGEKEANMLSKLKAALRALLLRRQAESELDEELRYHIEQQTEQNIRLGMIPEEARHAARKAFGGVEQAKERSRDA